MLVPVANGGEGTVDAMVAAIGGCKEVGTVRGSLGEPVDAFYDLTGDGRIDAVLSLLSKPCALDETLCDAAANVELTARTVAAVLRMRLARD